MSKHTPGPWYRVQTEICAEGPHGRIELATVHQEAEYWPLLPFEANAALIAAAPDMLAAIKAMIPFWNPDERARDCKIGVDEVLALIAKAEGKE